MADEEPTETEPLVQEEPKEEESPAADETAAGGAGESKDEKEDGDAEKGGEKDEGEESEKESWAVGESDSCFHFPDFIFMLAWLGSVLLVFVLAMTYGISAIENLDDIIETVEKYNDDLTAAASSYKILYIPSLAFAASAVLCIVWVVVMILCGTCILWSFFYGIIALCLACAIYCFTIYPYVAYAFLAAAGLVGLWAWCIRGRLNFAGKTLEIACHVISWYNSLVWMSLLMLALTGVYLALWVVGFVGLFVYLQYDSNDDDMTGGWFEEMLVYFTYIVFFFWTAEVLKNIVVVAVAGVMADWWKGEGGVSPVMHAFCRATTYNLGAITMGSLIVAIVLAIDAVCRGLKKFGDKMSQWWLSAAIDVILVINKCIICCLEWITGYVYTYVGIYGNSFIWAGGKTFALLATNGVTMAMNDSLVQMVITIGSVIVGLGSAAVSVVLVEDTDWADTYPSDSTTQTAWEMASFGWAIGWMVAGVVFGLVAAGNKAVLVLWIEHPQSLKKQHEKYYDELHDIWTNQLGFKTKGDEEAEGGCCGCCS